MNELTKRKIRKKIYLIVDHCICFGLLFSFRLISIYFACWGFVTLIVGTGFCFVESFSLGMMMSALSLLCIYSFYYAFVGQFKKTNTTKKNSALHNHKKTY